MTHPSGRTPVSLTLAFALLGTSIATGTGVAQEEDRWGPTMERFAELDRTEPSQPGGVLFLGSSSIRMWDLETWFPGRGYTNRGFGGSEISDSIHHFERLVLPHEPRKLFFYAGDNDIARGKSAETVAADFASFVELVHESLPETRVYFVAIKPSLSRWQLWSEMENANALIAEICDADERLVYVDVATPTLDREGQPMKNIFVVDGLHLNAEGYRIWTDVVGRHLRDHTGP